MNSCVIDSCTVNMISCVIDSCTVNMNSCATGNYNTSSNKSGIDCCNINILTDLLHIVFYYIKSTDNCNINRPSCNINILTDLLHIVFFYINSILIAAIFTLL